MDIKNCKVSDLIPYEKNTKKHDAKQIGNVAESIKQYGFVQPIVIDKNNVVVIGHCRLSAAKKLGMKEVPCVLVDDLTDEQIRALRLIDNKTNESDWDFEFLKDELEGLDLNGFDIDWGIDEDELAENDRDEQKEDGDVSVPGSRLVGFSISAFGMASECFLEQMLTQEQSDKIIKYVKESGASELCKRLIEVVENV